MHPTRLRRLLAAAGAALLTGAPAAAQPTPEAVGPSRTLTARDLFALQTAGDVQISPDGRTIAYVRAQPDIMTDRTRRALWLVDVATGAHTPFVANGSTPRWSPDGRQVAYVAAEEGAKPQLFVRTVATGAQARITSLPEGPSAIEWSPDGKQIAFTMFVPDEGAKLGAPLAKPEGARWADPIKVVTKIYYRSDAQGIMRPGYQHLFVVSAEGGAPRQLTFGKFDNESSVSWAPDGRSVLISTSRSKDWEREHNNTEIFSVDTADGRMTQLTSRVGPDGDPEYATDGRSIAFVGFDDKVLGYQNAGLYVMDRDGRNRRLLTEKLDRSVRAPRWAADGRSVFVQLEDGGLTKVARVGLDGRMTPVAEGLVGPGVDRPYTGGGFSVSRTGAVAFGGGDGQHPADVMLAAAGAKTRTLTRLNDDLFLGKTLGRVTQHTVKSSAGGLPIDYWMITPPNYDPQRKYPAILEIHGGPYTAYGPIFSADAQLWAAAGYVVLYANPRGSTSYGAAFANTIQANYPSNDYDDLMSVVDDSIAKGPVDANNLFVTGGSGGGLLTAWIVGKTDRFKAAVSQKPVVNWTSELLTSDLYSWMGKYWFGKMPWEDPQMLWRYSPISLVGNVKTPTLVIVGQDDYRTPTEQAEQLYAALQVRGVPTGLVYVPGAGHGTLTARPSQYAAKTAAILAWFERYRTDKPPGASRAE